MLSEPPQKNKFIGAVNNTEETEPNEQEDRTPTHVAGFQAPSKSGDRQERYRLIVRHHLISFG